MQLNPVASTVLVVFYLVTSVALVAILGFFLYALTKLNEKLAALESKIDPLLTKTEAILTVTNQKIVSLGERTDGILTHGEAVAEDVHDKVDKTAINVQRTINAPIIGINSVTAGLKHGLRTFRLLQWKPAEQYAAINTITKHYDEYNYNGLISALCCRNDSESKGCAGSLACRRRYLTTMADNKGDFLVGLLVGSALGAALALLYAPQSGEETRETIKKKGSELKDGATDVYGQVKDQTSTIASQLKDSTTTLAGNVKESASNVASKLSEAASKVKDDVKEGVSNVRTTAASEADTLSQAAKDEASKVKSATQTAGSMDPAI